MPCVAIIMPLFNDEEWVGRALESCLAQTCGDIEIICVDDASTDHTADIVQNFAARDSRVKLIRQEVNQSAFQARRAALSAARAPYVVFLDGDDELEPEAVARALDVALKTESDVVGFGVTVITEDGPGAPRFERSLQPPQETLVGSEVIATLLRPDQPAQGHLWRYLWKADLLEGAYARSSASSRFYRANDLPITFLALAAAQHYTAIPDKLYRYYFRRGTSGHLVETLDSFQFLLSALDSLDSIASAVEERCAQAADGNAIRVSYDSARRSVMGNLLRNILENTAPPLQQACLELLRNRVADDLELLIACATFCSAAIPLLTAAPRPAFEARQEVRSVLITTANLRAGGVQGVAVAQARELIRTGHRVTLAIFDATPAVHIVADGVDVVYLDGGTDAERVRQWVQLINDVEADIVVDHHILYNRRWPFLVLAALTVGVETIGWIHNFALRAMADSTDGISYLLRNLPLLRTTVVLSRTDVAFWKSQGVSNVVYLPNPASFTDVPAHVLPRTIGGDRIEIAWWGRLQQATKQVRDLIEIAAELDKRAVDFHLSIIGPDSRDLTAAQLTVAAERAGVSDRITLTGPQHGEQLAASIEQADLFISTSAIEGYPLTLIEAQAHGLPVVMYELGWLAALENNDGAIRVPQGDKSGMAEAIARLVADPETYHARSAGSLQAAKRALGHSFADLYMQLFAGTLPAEFSPDPAPDDLALLLANAVFFTERNARSAKRHALSDARAAEAAARVERELRRVSRELEAANRELRQTRRQLKATTNALSYRIGLAATYLPRKLRRLIRRR